MTDLIYLYSAYTIVWLGLFFYMVRLHLTQRRLDKDIKMLQEIFNENKRKKNL
jgi:CcmD family protein